MLSRYSQYLIGLLIYGLSCGGGGTSKPDVSMLDVYQDTGQSEQDDMSAGEIGEIEEIGGEIVEGVSEEKIKEEDISEQGFEEEIEEVAFEISEGTEGETEAECSNSEDCDDGNECTEDICDNGVCIHKCTCVMTCKTNEDCAGTSLCKLYKCVTSGSGNCVGSYCVDAPKVCDDNDPCTYDSCIDSMGCVFTEIPNCKGECEINEDCEDGLMCSEDKCQNAKCVHEAISCDDFDPCTFDQCIEGIGCMNKLDKNIPGCECAADEDCADGNWCTNEKCIGGECVYSIQTCDDLDPCTDDLCDPSSGQCLYTPNNLCTGECEKDDDCKLSVCISKAECDQLTKTCIYHPSENGTSCDDKNACTENDVCNDGKCQGTIISCDDNDLCTLDSCDSVKGCLHAPKTCDDNDPSTKDFCEPMTGECKHEFVQCDDGNPCTTDSMGPDGCVFTPKECKDDNPCTVDTCNTITGQCEFKAVECSDGDKCTDDACDPFTGGCVSTPKNCDDGNPETNDYCDPATGECIHVLIECDDGNICTDDFLDPTTGKCLHKIKDCNDNNLCTVDTCDQAKGCQNLEKICNDNNACTDDTCDKSTGECVFVKKQCVDNDPCTIDDCDPSVGCVFKPNPACKTCVKDQDCDDGNACTVNKCINGLCDFSTKVDCEDGNKCTVNTCDPAKGCLSEPLVCDDKNPCTIDICAPAKGCTTKPVDCNDNNPCTSEYCSPSQGGCVYVAKDGIECDDGNKCTTGDICKSKVCVGGSVIDCNDNDACTKDSCDPQVGCVHTQISCDDGDPCTIDTCDKIKGCINTPTQDCKTCKQDSDCYDDNVCTKERCVEGICDYSEKINCEDGNMCTVNTCDPVKGCQSEPLVCDDNNPCTTDLCAPASGCTFKPIDCNDNNPCTGEYCSPSQGGCVYVALNGKSCDDGNACTTGDVCKDKVCAGGTLITCDDGNICTDDSCDPLLGCVFVNNNKPCDDGDICTDGDICMEGKCTSKPKDCNDNNPCTTEFCLKDVGCVFYFNNLPCDDNNLCTEKDTCSNGKCQGTSIICSDNIKCTVDSCDPTKGCVFTPNHSICNDGNSCTFDYCDSKLDCQNTKLDDGTPCDDGDPTTINEYCTNGVCGNGQPAPNYALRLNGTNAQAVTSGVNLSKCFDLGFTVEGFVRPPNFQNNYPWQKRDVVALIPGKVYFYVRAISQGGNNSFLQIACLLSTNQADQYTGTVYQVSLGGIAGQWVHLACVKQATSTNVVVYLNGNALSQGQTTTQQVSGTPGSLFVGYNTPEQINQNTAYRHDELRLSSVARYTSNFQPPSVSTRFKPDANTCALWHFDDTLGSNIFKDHVAGMILTGSGGAVTGQQ